MPKSPTTSKRCMASLEERVKCIELHAKGWNYRQIEKEDKIMPDPQPGPKSKLTNRDMRHIKRLAEHDPHTTAIDIAQDSGVPVTPFMVGVKLCEMNLYV
ncbi:hypothetical protein HOY80DRAFT_1136425 [Tuber brumale]|nr:hypothetical protein HOY80DRAFT_1136425 [Tuber brumale]